MPKKYVIANFKMNKTDSEVAKYIDEFKPLIEKSSCQIVLSVPYVSIKTAVEKVSDSNITIAGQNLNENDFGAFTGEVNAEMLTAVGAQACIVGHSERRSKFNETDELINKKIMKGLRDGLICVLCIGETLFDKKNQKTEQVLKQQITKCLNSIYANELNHIVIAYEPVWAIGTGISATTDEIAQAISLIRKMLSNLYDADIASKVAIVYGGSINEENIKDIARLDDVDGVLVGGASLDPMSFSKIVLAFDDEERTNDKKTKKRVLKK